MSATCFRGPLFSFGRRFCIRHAGSWNLAASGKPLSAQLDGLPRMVSTPEILSICDDQVPGGGARRRTFPRDRKVSEVIGVVHSNRDGIAPRIQYAARFVMRFEAQTGSCSTIPVESGIRTGKARGAFKNRRAARTRRKNGDAIFSEDRPPRRPRSSKECHRKLSIQ